MKEVRYDILDEVEKWLFSTFSEYGIVKDLFLIGSILTNQINFNDIDIVQNINFDNNDELKIYSKIVKNIKDRFFAKFQTSLHITTFTQYESEELKEFMTKNKYLKII